MSGSVKKNLPSKVCEYNACGKSFEQRDNESPGRFHKRKFCGVECRQQAQRVDPNLERTCEACGKSFKCRDGEVGFRFMQRRSCDSTCAHALRKGKRYGDPTYSSSRKQRTTPRAKSKPPTIRIVEREPQPPAEPVRWVPAPTPKLRYVPNNTVPQVKNMTQAERTARRAQFGRAFKAS